MFKRKIIGLAAFAAIASPLAVVTTATSADAVTLYYSSCDKLHRAWPRGVAKGYAAAQYQVRQGNKRPAYGDLAKKVYWENYTRLDRDRDGTACEVTA